MGDLISIVPDGVHYDDMVEALYARTFGPGRFAKAAARLRENNHCLRAASFVALSLGSVVGACRTWPIIGQTPQRAVFLGPIAVDRSVQSQGLGHQLVSKCLAALHGNTVILVGDLGFFADLGFEIVPDGNVIMPGPVHPQRLLWRLAATDPVPSFGRLKPWPRQ